MRQRQKVQNFFEPFDKVLSDDCRCREVRGHRLFSSASARCEGLAEDNGAVAVCELPSEQVISDVNWCSYHAVDPRFAQLDDSYSLYLLRPVHLIMTRHDLSMTLGTQNMGLY